MIIGVDTGGTFTDFIVKCFDSVQVFKVLSTPENPAKAVMEGLNKSGWKAVDRGRVVHGSTVATNAILERKGAKTAFITNKGFEDILDIGRQNRKDLYNLTFSETRHLVGEGCAFGIDCRVNKDGESIADINLEEAGAVLEVLKKEMIDSVAVCFLFSFLNPEHEVFMKKKIESAGIAVSASHEVLAEFREFERASTTVINAYVYLRMDGYIDEIAEYTGKDRLSVMQSNGGCISAIAATREPVRTVLSGPAGGVAGALEIGRVAGFDRLITFDMGGTSTDVSIINGSLSISTEAEIAGLPIGIPMIDIQTVGAGGGSIASMDSGGSLRVGPESAGADPGPVCYGKGKRLTVTDANLYLGRLVANRFLGGGMQLEAGRLDRFFEDLSNQAGLEPVELAEGILDIANTVMERAIRSISVEKGHDPGDFTLFSFGGAGGMHAVFLARLLNIPRILIPRNPGVLSAMGMIMTDALKDYSRTVMLPGAEVSFGLLTEMFTGMEKSAIEDLALEGFEGKAVVIEKFFDMRYAGQSFEILVPCGADFVSNFHGLHQDLYGRSFSGKEVEVVNLRLRARGVRERHEIERIAQGGEKPHFSAMTGEAKAVFSGRSLATNVYNRESLLFGNLIYGPAIITEYSSTIVLPPESRGKVDEFGNILIEIL